MKTLAAQSNLNALMITGLLLSMGCSQVKITAIDLNNGADPNGALGVSTPAPVETGTTDGSPGAPGGPGGPPTNTEQTIKLLKPVLAVSDTRCLICHSNIKGNFVTDQGASLRQDDKIHLYYLDSANGNTDYVWPDYSTYGTRNFLSTLNMTGELTVPKVELTAASQAFAAEIIQEYKSTAINKAPKIDTAAGPLADLPTGYFLKTEAPTNPVTLSEYMNSFLNFRTVDNFIMLAKVREKQKYAELTERSNNIVIKEVKKVTIDAPTAAELQSLLKGERFVYFPEAGSTIVLKNFEDHNSFFMNKTGEIFECDGDLIVDDVVYLKNLNLKSNTGCRIYSTKTVFVESTASPGIDYSNSAVGATLQITSSRAVLLGLGKCSSGNIFTSRRGNSAESIADYQSVKINNELVIMDAGNCGNRTVASRKVNFERILLNAPRVDSRYTGDFKGVIITRFSVWSLGQFKFEYDSSFDNAKILPRLTRPILSIEN